MTNALLPHRSIVVSRKRPTIATTAAATGVKHTTKPVARPVLSAKATRANFLRTTTVVVARVMSIVTASRYFLGTFNLPQYELIHRLKELSSSTRQELVKHGASMHQYLPLLAFVDGVQEDWRSAARTTAFKQAFSNNHCIYIVGQQLEALVNGCVPETGRRLYFLFIALTCTREGGGTSDFKGLRKLAGVIFGPCVKMFNVFLSYQCANNTSRPMGMSRTRRAFKKVNRLLGETLEEMSEQQAQDRRLLSSLSGSTASTTTDTLPAPDRNPLEPLLPLAYSGKPVPKMPQEQHAGETPDENLRVASRSTSQRMIPAVRRKEILSYWEGRKAAYPGFLSRKR